MRQHKMKKNAMVKTEAFSAFNFSANSFYFSQSFDRDEPAREKIAYVTVKATDRGTPPLEAICTFNVTIGDINDNAPMVCFEMSVFDMVLNELVIFNYLLLTV